MSEEKNDIGTIIESVNGSDIMNNYFLGYATYTICDRAIPKIEDGLKPVQRRVLYSMHDLGLFSNKPTKKSAKVTGNCLASFHPHGDQSVYDAMINLAQDWRKRYPLVFVQGNFGNIDGDPPAAARYTEARLTKLGEYMMEDINKNTVDMVPNYDESTVEPSVLPSLFPNLICNGIVGTATGIATSMAPHYAKDVYKAIDYILECALKQEVPDIDKVISIIKAPDFPTGGIIINASDMRNTYKTGKGRVQIRGKYTYDDKNNRIIITEIPYMVNKAKLVSDIGKVCLSDTATVDGVKDVNDESNKDGIKIVIQLKKNANFNFILNHLYKKTELQSSFSINNTAIINKRPAENISLQQLLSAFIQHACEVIYRKTRYDLGEYTKRNHLIEGYITAIGKIDKLIESIKKSNTPEEKLSNVMDLGFDEIQAKAIIAMSIGSISNMDEEKFIAEKEKLERNIAINTEIITNKFKLLEECKKTLKDFAESSALKDDKRKTEISNIGVDSITERDLIDDEDVVIIMTKNEMIKSVKVSEYETQKRNGKGTAVKTKDDDQVKDVISASTKDNLLIFTQLGKCHILPVYKIPITNKSSVGKYLVNFIDLDSSAGEKVVSVLVARHDESDKNLVMVTKNGNIKKTTLDMIIRRRGSSTKVIEFRDNDTLVNAHIAKDNEYIFSATAKGMGCKIKLDSINVVKSKAGMGVRLIKLRDDDRLVSSVILNDDDNEVCIMTANGYAKKADTNLITPKGRGVKGQRIIGLTENDYVVDVTLVSNKTLFIVTTNGMIIRIPTDSINVYGLSARGTKTIKLKDGDSVRSISMAPDSNEADDEENTDG